MFEARCEGCQTPFEVDERRIPVAGMRMRCPKCGASFMVYRPGMSASPMVPAPLEPDVRAGETALPALAEPRVALPRVAAAGGPKPAGGFASPGQGLPLPEDLAVGLPVPRDLVVGLPALSQHGVGLPRLRDEVTGLPSARDASGLPVLRDDPGLHRVAEGLSPAEKDHGDVFAVDDSELMIPESAQSPFGPAPVPEPEVAPSPSTLGRIPLERKAFTVSEMKDLPLAVSGAKGSRASRRDEIDLGGLGGVGRSSALAESLEGRGRPPTTLAEDPGASKQGHAPGVGGMDFGEIDLGAADASRASFTSLPPPRMDPPGASGYSPRATGTDFGGELESLPHPPAAPAREKKINKAFREIKPVTPTEESKLKSRRMLALYASLAIVSVVIVGGAALANTEYGAFGRNWFDDKVHGAERHTAAARVIASVDRMLEEDRYERAIQGLRRLDQAIARVPQERELRAYTVYANNLVVARFGADPARVGHARSILSELSHASSSMRYMNLARASDALSRGSFRDATRLSGNSPQGRDLATFAALGQGDLTGALRLARSAREAHPTARSRYLLIRALVGTGDNASAAREAEDTLRVAPEHVGTRILLARLLGRTPQSRERALSLVRSIVPDEIPGQRPAPGALMASASERAEANVVAGQVEFARDHPTYAQERFQRALELDPRSSAALVGLGLILYRQGHFTDALARFRNSASADRQNLDAVIGIAQSCLALNQHPKAREVLEPVLAEHTSDDRLHYWYGRALMGTPERAAAEREFREAIRLEAGNLEAYVALSELLIVLQRTGEAEQVLLEARQRVPDGAAIHRAMAHGRLAQNDPQGAEAELHTAIAREPDDMQSHFALGEVYRQQGMADGPRREAFLAQAEREFEVVSHGDPNYPGLAMVRGQIAEARGKLPEALYTFNEQLLREPLNVDLRTRVASIQVALGNFGEAAQTLSGMARDHPTHAEAQFYMGRAKLGTENYTEAVRYFDRAMELNPQRADFKAYAAEANFRVGNVVRARLLAEQSIELDPRFPRGYWVRASIRVHHGEAVPALADINRATQLDPRLWGAYATWAEVDEALGHPRDAIVLYRRALAADPHHGDWYYNLGRLLSDEGDTGEARAAFERARNTFGHARNAAGAAVPVPTWYLQSTRALADLLRQGSPAQARALYEEFLSWVPASSAAAIDVQNTLHDMPQR